ncbi:ABC transporter permease [Paremcibacter congregatus]|uniref:Peptide ABC transporter permease n=1 Tax=Paremcibacter congregatus TaxID=2043170 RepID=A0A2G4YU69_9PROT|nr:ABC transporter permease [Paremcibacter congregatus]PHZ85882.1 peptide ABC transporter permease [Paremcibacter congregatus]QDE26847.1 FtsX-like permease family protein [Paremcibacter congregatus]
MRLLSQTWVVIIMNIRSLPSRFSMSLATIFAVAAVVGVLLFFLAMGNGFRATLEGAGSDAVAVVTREGSQSEINSVLGRDQVNLIANAPGIARDDAGNPIISAELYVIVDGIKESTKTKVNLPLRGLSQAGFDLRDNVKITDGRMFSPGRNEIIVGEGVLKEFGGFSLGKKITFGKTTWEVVGIFTTGGSAFESELWADARSVQDQFRRGNSFQTMRLRLETPGDVSALQAYAKTDPRLNVKIETEANYFSTQGDAIKGYVIFGWGVSIIMGLGALAGALNTMYTSVASRAREIATLRAIGFSNVSAFMGTLVEGILLSLLGGVLGIVATYLFIDGNSAATIGASFTQVVFTFTLSPDLMVQGGWIALAIGVLGGFFPAFRAARLPVVIAFE